jgi:O-antigen/teichoic acid export membrane protein
MTKKSKADKNSYASLKREITLFLVFLGILLGVIGYFFYTGLKGNPRQLWGLDRNIAFGVPFQLFGTLFLACGMGFGITSRKTFAILGGVVVTLFAIFYFVLMSSATGELAINFMSVVMVAIPILFWSRLNAFFNANQDEQADILVPANKSNIN